MNDVEARREARRRRILENSENRLQKISGVEKRTCGYQIEGYKNSHLNITEEDSILNGDVTNAHEIFTETNSILNRNSESQTSNVANQQKCLTKKQRISIIVGIATALNILIICFQDNILLNKIFLPLLCFEAIDLFYHQNQIEMSGGVLNLMSILYRNTIPTFTTIAIKYCTLTIVLIKDVMLYFLVFICIYYVTKVLKDILFF